MTPTAATEYLTEHNFPECVLIRATASYFNTRINAIEASLGLPTKTESEMLAAITTCLNSAIITPQQ